MLVSYKNGDYNIELFEDGTLVRTTDVDNPQLVHPTSMDVKITNYCDMGCTYCHESSTTAGKHGDLNKLLEVIEDLPGGVELALGGGNPLAHPDLIPFLVNLKMRGIIANITVNQGHLKPFYDMLVYLIESDLVKGVGISLTSNNFKYIKKLKALTDNIVFHVIAGVNKVEVMDQLLELDNPKVLVLGYKTFGFGKDYFNADVTLEISRWYMYLPKYLGKCVLSFDNLAIEQLNVKRLFTAQGWDKFYMGNDFVFTMYLDAIKQEYAPTSRSSNRVKFSEDTLLGYFQKNKGSKI